MSGKMSEVYDLYEMELSQGARVRGAMMLKAENDTYKLDPLMVNEKRVMAEFLFKEKLYESGFAMTDRCVPNSEGELVTYDRYDNPYVLRYAYEGKECNVYSKDDVLLAVKTLAKLHKHCKKAFDDTEQDVHIRVCGDFAKRNAELRRVKNYIIKKTPKRVFEELYLTHFDYFYKQAVFCEEKYGSEKLSEAGNHMGYCHGMYNQHSVIFLEKKVDNVETAVVNFEKFYVGNQLADLYHFMRKIVEKNGYDFSFCRDIIEKYDEIIPLDSRDIEYIYICCSYPEKFYKISNQYINTSKNWISPKLIEKLNKIIENESRKTQFLEELFQYKTSYKN